MRSFILVLLCALVATTVMVVADESSVQSDPTADFSALRTFAIRAQQVASRREELDNPIFLKKLAAAIRTSLVAKGLTERTDQPDVVVDFTVTGEEFADVERRLIRGIRGGPVRVSRPIRISEGTLVIDIYRRQEAEPIWRGVYRDDERTGSKLTSRLPEDAKRLLAKYPKR